MPVNQQFFFQWAVLSSTLAMATQQVCWPQEACWVARVSGPWAQRASTPATLTLTPRNTGRSKIASIQWRGGWSPRSQTPWRVWLRRRRRRRPGGCSCSSTRLPSQWNDPSRHQSTFTQFKLADLSHFRVLTNIFMCVLQRQSNPGNRSGYRRKAGLNVRTDGKIHSWAEGFWVGQWRRRELKPVTPLLRSFVFVNILFKNSSTINQSGWFFPLWCQTNTQQWGHTYYNRINWFKVITQHHPTVLQFYSEATNRLRNISK